MLRTHLPYVYMNRAVEYWRKSCRLCAPDQKRVVSIMLMPWPVSFHGSCTVETAKSNLYASCT